MENEARCLDCLADPLPLEWCDAWGHYRGALEVLLHAFKFERHDFLDHALASLLEETIRSRGDVAFDGVVAIPMHGTKLRRRGYNQAELLAAALAKRLALPLRRRWLRKRRERQTQSRLRRAERAANVRGLFQAGRVEGKSILLVDDINTTGETLRECAAALLRAGATRVCAVTVAKVS